MFSGNKFLICAPSNLKLCFQTISCLGNKHKCCLSCELDLENDKICLSWSLDADQLRSQKLRKLQHANAIETARHWKRLFKLTQEVPFWNFSILFLFYLNVSDALITEINDDLHPRLTNICCYEPIQILCLFQ